MAKKPNITQVNSLDGITTVINTNFNNVADAFDNTLSRDGSTPNQMEADIDMNSNDLLNVGSIDTNSLRLNGEAVSTELQAFATDIKYSFDYVSSLLSDERTYKYFAEGDIVEAEGFRYKVAPSTATDHHLTTAGGVKLHRLYDVKSEFKSITRPDSFAVAAGAAGGLTGSYTWAMTYVDSEGNETEPSPRIGPVALASQQASLTGLPVSADPRVVARRIYRTVANPSDILFLNLVAEIDNVATSYTDDLADVSLGTPIPWIDVTGGVVEVDGERVGNFKGNTIAFGQYAGGNLSGYANSWFGNYAGAANVDGLRCCGFGVYALASNVSGLRNTAMGVHALNDNVSGEDLTAFGYGAGFKALNGGGTYVGAYAGGSSQDPMTAIGAFSMIQNLGRDHTAIGAYTGWSNITGSRCVYIGNYAGYYNTLSDAFVLDNRQRVNEADEHNKALLYGRFGVGNGDQFVKVNGTFKSANCQADTPAMPNGSSAGGAMNTDGSMFYSIGGATATANAAVYYGGGGVVGVISVDGTSTSFTSLSDERAKTNIVDAPSAADQIAELKVRSFDWRNGGGHVDYGFIAQELHEARPEAVVVGDDETPWTADASKLIPLLVKAVQEAQAEIAELKSRMA